MEENDTRISLDTVPGIREEIEALLDDPERLRRSGVHRKTVERIRREGLPKQYKLVMHDLGIARALCAAAEQKAA